MSDAENNENKDDFLGNITSRTMRASTEFARGSVEAASKGWDIYFSFLNQSGTAFPQNTLLAAMQGYQGYYMGLADASRDAEKAFNKE